MAEAAEEEMMQGCRVVGTARVYGGNGGIDMGDGEDVNRLIDGTVSRSARNV